MPYDYGRSIISRYTGLTGIEAEHIAKKLKELNVDPQAIDWEGAISDARDYGNRYEAVKNYIANYYGIAVDAKSTTGYQPEQDEMAILMDQASTKAGVKRILKEYYSTNSKKQKEEIKEMLLAEGPLYNVLMTAMYNGTDMPNARKFLNESMREQVINTTTIQPTTISQFGPKDKVVKQPATIFGPEEWPNTLRNGQKIKKEIMEKPKSIMDMEKIYRELLKEKQKQLPTFQTKQPDIPSESEIKKKIMAGIVREGKIWKKLLSGETKARPGSPEFWKLQVARLRAANLPLQLQLERERLLMQREQMMGLKKTIQQKQRQTATQQVLAWMGLVPIQQMPESAFHRPGYYVEARPRLPSGFRYKKLPKRKKQKQQPKQPQIMIY